jgi:accessory gene regulator protein AgrB
MNSASISTLYRVAAAMTVVIAVAFMIFGLVIQNWMVLGVFAVIGIAGLSVWPSATRKP